MSFENSLLVSMYKTMLTIRKFEEKCAELYAANRLGGSVHLYSGEEAVAVGACFTLREDDFITSTHRGHGHLIAKGGRLDKMMAELMGKKTGYCKGKGGSMHVTDLQLGSLGANGIVGSGFNIACGAGLACQRLYGDRIVLCFFGDGAANRGTFHEGLNLASIWKLPVVFICENNQYGISVSQKRSMNVQDISVRAKSYNMPGTTVDGMDVKAIFEEVKRAVEYARKGFGPSLIECKTYRYRGHWEGDPIAYRTDEEVDEWRKKDAIIRTKKELLEKKVVTQLELDRIAEKIDEEIKLAIKYGEESPFPEKEDALEDVYESGVEVSPR